MTKVYVAHYALQSDLEAELDDPSLAEGGLEGMACPQVSAVLTGVTGPGIERLMREVEAEYRRSLGYEPGQGDACTCNPEVGAAHGFDCPLYEPKLEWRHQSSNLDTKTGVESHVTCLFDGEDEVAILVVRSQEVEP